MRGLREGVLPQIEPQGAHSGRAPRGRSEAAEAVFLLLLLDQDERRVKPESPRADPHGGEAVPVPKVSEAVREAAMATYDKPIHM